MGWFSWCYKFRSQAARAMGMDLQHQQVRYARTLAEYVAADSAWLDLGCGHQFYPSWARVGSLPAEELAARPRLLCGLDGDLDSIRRHRQISNRVLGDVCRLPFRDGSFTVISANMVMEHVADPAAAGRRLTGLEVEAVTEDASPRGATTIALWEPPLTTHTGENDAPVRRSAASETAASTS